MLPMNEGRGIVIEDRLSDSTMTDLYKLGIRLSVVQGYGYHMGSYSVIVRDGASDTYTAVADPRRCAVAAGIAA